MTKSRNWPVVACLAISLGCDLFNDGDSLGVVVDVVSAYHGGRPITVTALLERVIVHGGPGLGCGIAGASGRAALEGSGRLVVSVALRPDECPNRPVGGSYTATVPRLPSGTYEVEVRQRYWLDQPEVIVTAQVVVP